MNEEPVLVWATPDYAEAQGAAAAIRVEWPKFTVTVSFARDNYVVTVENARPPFGGVVLHAFCSGFAAGRKSKK